MFNMGCDIHPHIEVKIKGKWYHYSIPLLGRNYQLFTRICGVRGYEGVIPIDQPRGLPSDLSEITRIEVDYDGPDGHSHTWLNRQELNDLIKWHEELYTKHDRFFQAQHEKWGYM